MTWDSNWTNFCYVWYYSAASSFHLDSTWQFFLFRHWYNIGVSHTWSRTRMVPIPKFGQWLVPPLGNGTKLRSLLTPNIAQYIGFGVDDVDLVVTNNMEPCNPKQTLQTLQNTLDLWEWDCRLLEGHYWPKKSLDIYWFSVEQKSMDYKPTAQLPGTLFMNDVSGHTFPLND